MKSRFFLAACIILTLSSCSTPKTGGTYTPTTKYENVTSLVAANQESTVELSDGAQITIPENSLTGDSTVTIERNASKTAFLPPLGDMDLPLSDFYNFQVEGGQLAGPVDLIIPFDESKLPKQNGYLVAMIPTERGWKYIPVEANGNKANLYTTELGDPLIAWQFICAPGDSEEACNQTLMKNREDAAICSPDIALSIIPEKGTTETQYEVFGQLVPAKTRYWGILSRKPAENIPVEIVINQREPGSGTTRSLITDSNGKFNFTLDASDNSSGLREDWNWLWVIANCDPWFGEIAVKSQGYVQFKISPEVVTPLPTEPPAAQPQPIIPPQSPTDKIPVPDVVGMTFKDAQTTLENLGFNTTWIDGKSNLELGKIYSQAPVAGTLSVPHRTTVVIYRTTETISAQSEYGCNNPSLTPEELANCGEHQYSNNEKIITCDWSEGKEAQATTTQFIVTVTYNFSSDGYLLLSEGACSNIRVRPNIFEYNCSQFNDHGTIIFTKTGYTADSQDTHCTYHNESIIIK